MQAATVARWFLEAVGFGDVKSVDPWRLARRWGFTVAGRRNSAVQHRRHDVIWIDDAAPRAEQRVELARALARIAIEISGADVDDPARVAEYLLDPARTIVAREAARPPLRRAGGGSASISPRPSPRART